MNLRFFGLYTIAVAMTLSILSQTACESWWTEDGECTPAPFDCLDVRPTEGDLVVHSTINGNNLAVPIWVFRGDFENDDLVFQDTLESSGATYVLPADQYYSVVALYIRSNGDTVVAIDGDDIDIDYDDHCGGVRCYSVDDAEIDVTLN